MSTSTDADVRRLIAEATRLNILEELAASFFRPPPSYGSAEAMAGSAAIPPSPQIISIQRLSAADSPAIANVQLPRNQISVPNSTAAAQPPPPYSDAVGSDAVVAVEITRPLSNAAVIVVEPPIRRRYYRRRRICCEQACFVLGFVPLFIMPTALIVMTLFVYIYYGIICGEI